MVKTIAYGQPLLRIDHVNFVQKVDQMRHPHVVFGRQTLACSQFMRQTAAFVHHWHHSHFVPLCYFVRFVAQKVA